MMDFIEYVVSELKSKRLSKTNALSLIKQFSQRAPASAAPLLHPLLHENTSDMRQQSYRTVFTGSEFFLADHQIQVAADKRSKVLPGVAYLEMARAAIAHAMPDRVAEETLELRDVIWAQPIVVEQASAVGIALFEESEHRVAFEIFSESDDGDDVVHCQGEAVFVAGGDVVRHDVAALQGQMQKNALDAASVYARFAAMGLHYGPAHRGIVDLQRGDKQSLARLRLPATADGEGWVLHPSVMDGALQAILGLAEDHSQEKAQESAPWLPFAVEKVRVLAACEHDMLAWVRFTPGVAVSEHVRKVDIDVCTQDGRVCVQLRGFTSRVLARERVAPSHPKASDVSSAVPAVKVGTLVALPRWEPLELTQTSQNQQGNDADNAVHTLLVGFDAQAVSVLQKTFPESVVLDFPAVSDEAFFEAFTALSLSAFATLQSLLPRAAKQKLRLQCAVGGERAAQLGAAFAALMKTAQLENPQFSAQVLQFETTVEGAQIVDTLRRARGHAEHDRLAFREQQASTLRWQEVAEVGAEVAFKDNGVYLITGGLGGLGAVFAEEILRVCDKAHVVVAGRSELSKEKARWLADLQAQGAHIRYEKVDLASLAQTRELIEGLCAEHAQLNGVLHCAGTLRDNFLLKKTAEEFRQVFSPKVAGALNLDIALREADVSSLDFLALFSSGVAAFGNAGQADYAMANAFMDAFAAERNRLRDLGQRHGLTQSINWPLWQSGGMQLAEANVMSLEQATGMRPMSDAAGVQAFYRSLATREAQCLVMDGDLTRIRALVLQQHATTMEVKVPAVANANTASSANTLSTGAAIDLREHTERFLREEFSTVLKVPAAQLELDAPLERYGINSILAMNLTAQLERSFGALSKTLFFEYQSIGELIDYFIADHQDSLRTRFAVKSDAAVPAPAAAVVEALPAPSAGVRSRRLQRRGRRVEASPPRTQNAPQHLREPIAIIGLSGRYPEAENIQQYWRNLREGRDCIVEVPAQRWRWQDYYTEDRNQRGHYSKWGGFIAGVDEFDPQFFNISPREAAYIDPQERLFLQHAWMALEDAAYTRQRLQIARDNNLPAQVGVYVGVMYGEYNASGSLASIANRVSYVLNLHGPSMTLDTMCSSSLTAIHLACQDLRNGNTDLAIAGGVNVSVHPNKYSMLSAGQFISSDGHCQSFGEGGDGYIPGEGVGAVLLKRLSEAEADGDAIYAIIRGSALNHGGKTNGYTVPNPHAQAAVISQALNQAGVAPRQLSYIEAHGTGTKLGDPIEIAALGKAFQTHTQDTQFCLLGSAKSNIGHCESAAGIAGLTKILLQMQHREIVPSLHSARLNPNIDFARSPFIVNQQLRAWEAPQVDGRDQPRIAGLSSFGAGGANAHFVIEEWIAPRRERATVAHEVIVPLSARTAAQLKQKARALLDHLQHDPDTDLAALAYTLQVGREAMDERLALLARDVTTLQSLLGRWLDDDQSAVYQGQVPANKATLALFIADSDFAETVDKWIAHKKFAKLADLWVKGLDLDWQKFYAGKVPQRLHLPTYPFAREKYWIDPIQGLFPTERNPARAQTRLHPLLHENTSTVDALRFSSQLHGETLFSQQPATAMLELARAALIQAKGAAAYAAAVELSDLQWGEAFAIDAALPLHIALAPEEDEGLWFDIYSEDASAEWVHCQGRARLLPAEPMALVDFAAFEIPARAVSTALAPARLQVQKLFATDDTLTLTLQCDAPLAAQLPGCDLHPVLLQTVFDIAAEVFSLPGSAPRQVSRLRVNFPCSANMKLRLRRENEVWQLDACDMQGHVCWQMQGLVLGEARAAVSDAESFATSPEVSAPMPAATPALMNVIVPQSLPKPEAIALNTLTALDTPKKTVLAKPRTLRLALTHETLIHETSPVAARIQRAELTHSRAGVTNHAVNAPQNNTEAQHKTEPQTNAAPRSREALQHYLRRSLAEALYLSEVDIDNEKSFVDLGLDSIVGVEWVKVINKDLALEISATRVYDYANISALAGFLQTQLPATEQMAVATPAQAAEAPMPIVAKMQTDPQVYLIQYLRSSLAEALYLSESDIDAEKSFVDLGLDSIVGVEWVKSINKHLALEISATRVYDYANIHALAGFLKGELGERGLALAAPVNEGAAENTPMQREPSQQHSTQPAHAKTVSARPAPEKHFTGDNTSRLQRRRRPAYTPVASALKTDATAAQTPVREKIAIVGMSGRYPDAENLDQFWDNLVAGKNAIKEIPASRWDVSAYYDPTPGTPGKVYCKWLGLLDDAECFDPLFFQISPSEAEIMDPQHRLFMQEAYRAFEDAGYANRQLSNQKCGVYLGIMSSEYSFMLAKGNPLNVETTGNSFAIGAARIAYHLNLKGPAIPIDTACSSSLVAMHLACQALRNGEIDMGLAGGVSLYLIPESYQGMCRAGMLSPEGQCKTFDNAANGFVPGEGVGAVVLKRLSDAERDGDSIYGVIIGSGINQDGKTNGITAPSVNSQIELERDIYRRYQIDPRSISYIETHGTGTKLGDPIELEALSTVFKEHCTDKQFCALGAVKSNVGHTSGAAGVAGVHKVLLSLRHKMLAPSLNVRTENALFDLAKSPFYICKQAQFWEVPAGNKRRAAVSAFGFSGTNAHLVIEEYIAEARVDHASGDYIVPLSARTVMQLQARALDLHRYLTRVIDTGATMSLRDLAYTLQTGREAMRERCAWVVSSVAQLQAALAAFVDGELPALRGTAAREAQAEIDHDDRAQTHALAQAWVQGAELHWQNFYQHAPAQRLHLPTYPFAKDKYWVKVTQSASPIAASYGDNVVDAEIIDGADEKVDDKIAVKQQTYYGLAWQDQALSSNAEARSASAATYLLLDSDEQSLAECRAAFAEHCVIGLRLAESYGEGEDNCFSVNAGEVAHFEYVLNTLAERGQIPSAIIHNANAACLGAKPLGQNDPVDRESGALASIDAVFSLAQALLRHKALPHTIEFISYYYCDAESNTALCAALSGFYKSLNQESRRVRGRVLQLALAEDAAQSNATWEVLGHFLCGAKGEHVEWRYRSAAGASAQWSTRVLRPCTPDAQLRPELPLKQRGVYVITGGLGGLGELFSRHLAEHYQARLVLSGRSALSEKLQKKISELKTLGAEVLYVAADIADAAQVEALINEAKATFGAINGIIHSAGVNHDALLSNKKREDSQQVLAPKVQGTLNLDRFTAGEMLDIFVLFSSGAGCFGNIGQTDYAFGNYFMDNFAEYRDHLQRQQQRFGKTLSIAWPFWEEGGMRLSAADLQHTELRAGMCALPTNIGINYWETLLRSDLCHALALYGHADKIAAYCQPGLGAVALPEPRLQSATAKPLITPTTSSHSELIALCENYLRQLVNNETKIPLDDIDSAERFEAFGFDSVMIGRFNAALERDLGALSKTLLYEYESIAELAEYLCTQARDAVAAHVLAADAQVALDHSKANNNTLSSTDNSRTAEIPVAVEPIYQGTLVQESDTREAIAIIGVHSYTPRAETLDAFWQQLCGGKEIISEVPRNRWDSEALFDADPERAADGKIYCKWGGFLDDFDKFDAGFFNLSADEAKVLDPQERWFMQSAWAAMEDAGYTREQLKSQHPKGKSADVGVFVGVTTNSYPLLASEEWQRGNMVAPSAMPWSIANRVSYFFDFQGPSMPIDTACSSSLVAVHLACESLRRRECQVALAGGVNLYLHPAKYQSFCQRRMLAQHGKCRSFGAGDDGFVPGEGVGTLMLKPLSAAERDGDHVYALIRGSAFDHSGRSNGYAAPNPNAQARIIGKTLENAGVAATSIGYIEAHGTGTQLGDSLEIAAIGQAFAQHSDATQFCAIGSVKANIGHAESATSIAGIAKILLQFRHQQFAPSINAEEPNPNIDFASAPCYLQTALKPWLSTEGHPRRALINAFGAGGVNACAVLEEYLAPTAHDENANQGPWLFVLSAKNKARLREYAGRFVQHLQKNRDIDLGALCYTLQLGREAMQERLAVVIENRQPLVTALQEWLRNKNTTTQMASGSLDPRQLNKRATPAQREHMQQLCSTGDLNALATLWAEGAEVNWALLYAEGKPQRLSLPVYPFARERHWLSETQAETVGSMRQIATTQHNSVSRLHPLVSHNSSTLKQVSFLTQLDGQQFYARDHKVQHQAIFPGAGFVEMACVAATIAGQQRVKHIKDIVWVHPLPLGENAPSLQTLLKPIGISTEFEVVSFDEDREKSVHCEGRVIFSPDAEHVETKGPVLSEWQQRCDQSKSGEALYRSFRAIGIDYGPAFQVIQAVKLGGDCALATLQLPTLQFAEFEQYLLHPCLLDGALQSVVALLSGADNAVPHLPFAIDDITIHGSLTPHCYALVERAEDARSSHAEIQQFMIYLVSETGEPLVTITNFYVRALHLTPATQHGKSQVVSS